MDVTSLYTNIDHEEGSDACFQKLETRKNKSVRSKILKDLIILVLKLQNYKRARSARIVVSILFIKSSEDLILNSPNPPVKS